MFFCEIWFVLYCLVLLLLCVVLVELCYVCICYDYMVGEFVVCIFDGFIVCGWLFVNGDVIEIIEFGMQVFV